MVRVPEVPETPKYPLLPRLPHRQSFSNRAGLVAVYLTVC